MFLTGVGSKGYFKDWVKDLRGRCFTSGTGCHGTMRRNEELIERYAANAPRATAHGQRLHASGALREAARAGVPMKEALGLLRVPR